MKNNYNSKDHISRSMLLCSILITTVIISASCYTISNLQAQPTSTLPPCSSMIAHSCEVPLPPGIRVLNTTNTTTNNQPLNSTLPKPLPLPSSSRLQPNATLPRQLIISPSQLPNATLPPQTNATLPKPLPQSPSQRPNSTLSANITGRPSQQPTATTPRPSLGFISKGTINSLINTPTASWIASGTWTMNVDNGSVTFFDTKMTWFNNNGKTSHTHEFRNFKGGIVTVQQPMNDVFLKGVMDVGTNHHIVWKNVPTMISIHGGKTVTILVADNATNRHFAGQPILGLVNSFEPCSDVPGANMEVLPSCR